VDEPFTRFTQLAENAIGRLKIKGALNGCLCLVGVTFIPGLWALTKLSGLMQWAVLFIIIMPFVFYGISHFHFTFNDPDKLRSEDYELRKQALELIEEKGGRIPLSDASIEMIANPNYPARLGGKEEDAHG
jgi:hypothetical protein